jgi:hypothetical protein
MFDPLAKRAAERALEVAGTAPREERTGRFERGVEEPVAGSGTERSEEVTGR